jgi:hypothetical protein
MKIYPFICVTFLFLFSCICAMRDENALYENYSRGMNVIAKIYGLTLQEDIQGKVKIYRADEFDCLRQTKQGTYIELMQKGNNLSACLYAPFGVITFIRNIIYEPKNIQAYDALKNRIMEVKGLRFIGKQTRGCVIDQNTGQYDPQEPECTLYEVALEGKKALLFQPRFITKKENAEYKKESGQLMRKLVDRYLEEYFKR